MASTGVCSKESGIERRSTRMAASRCKHTTPSTAMRAPILQIPWLPPSAVALAEAGLAEGSTTSQQNRGYNERQRLSYGYRLPSRC